MSTTIDQRVVEMRFDNKQFESNVSTTMSTLDKLKQKLNLDGASKGLENVNAAAGKVNMSGLGSAVESVSAKFSALQVMGVTALANITNSAVNAGKRIVKSFTVDPIKSGFNEYELKMNSIQTIMAGTGESLATVNKYLNELNTYSDKTIYSFQDMTSNIGKFTNAGVKLEDAVMAIKGISNEAAVSGASASQASHAMYNLAQALSSGYVKLIDWKSIENAQMATMEFKEQLIETAVAAGTLKDAGDGMYETLEGKTLNATKGFNDTLQDQWMTSEVLITTLKKYADETTEIGSKATEAATKVKTFTQLMDTLKEAAQSGWAQTWELLVGDFEEARAFFTELSDIFGGIIGDSADRRNNLLGGALNSKWDNFIEKVNEAGATTDEFQEKLKEVGGDNLNLDALIEKYGSFDRVMSSGEISSSLIIKTLKELAGVEKEVNSQTEDLTAKFETYQNIVDEIWHGKWDHGSARVKNLTEAGYNYDIAQSLVNISAARKDNKITLEDYIAVLEKYEETNENCTEAEKEEIAALKELAEQAEKTGTPISELIADLEKPSGRELLLDSVMNTIKAIQRPLQAVGEALRNTFAVTSDDVYKIFERINKFTESFVMEGLFDITTWKQLDRFVSKFGVKFSKFEEKLTGVLKANGIDVDELIEKYGSLGDAFEAGALSFDHIKEALLEFEGITESLLIGGVNADKIRRTFEGLFAIIDIIATVMSGPLKFAFKVASDVLSRMGLTILDVTARIGDAIVKFRDNLDRVIDAVTTFIVDNVAKWITQFKETEFFKTVAGWFESASETITGAIDNISGRIDNFATSGAFTSFTRAFGTVSGWINTIADDLSNSQIFIAMVDGVCAAFDKVKTFFGGFKLPEFSLDNLKTFVTDLVKIGEKSDASGFTGALGAVAGLGAHVKDNVISWDWTVFKETALEKFVTFWLKTGDKIKAAFNTCKEVALAIKEFIFGTEQVNLQTIMDLVTKFLWIVTLIKTIKLLDTIVSPFDNVSNALKQFATSLKWDAMAGAFKAMALALAAFAICIMVIVGIGDMKKAWSAAGMMIAMMIVMGGVISAMGAFAANGTGVDTAGAIAALLMLVGSIAILVYVLKEIDQLKLQNPVKTFGILFATLLAATMGIRMVSKAGGSSFRTVAAILTLMAALKLILDVVTAYDEFDWTGKSGAIKKMVEMMLVLALAINVMSRGTKAGASSSGLAFAILAMVFSLKIILSAIKEIATISDEDLERGGKVVGALLGTMTIMMAVANLTNKGSVLEKGQKSVNNFTGFALALLAVVAAIWLLGKMDVDTLRQGGFAVGQVLILFTGLLAALGLSCSGLKMGPIVAMLVGFGLLMGEMALILYLLRDLKPENSIATAGALTTLLISIAGVLAVLGKFDVKAKILYKWIGAMTALVGVVALLAFILQQVKEINPVNAIGNATALGILMSTMAGVLVILTKHRNGAKSIYKWIGAMAAFALVIAELAAVLHLIKDINPANAIGNVVAIDILLAGMSVCITTLAKHRNGAKSIYKWIGAMATFGLVVAELALILHLVKDVDPVNAIGNVTALSVLMAAMAGVLTILSTFKVKANFSALGAMTVLGLVMTELVGVMYLMKGIDPVKAIPQVLALSILATVLTALLIPLSLVGMFGTAGLLGVGTLATLAASLFVLVGVFAAMSGVDNAASNAKTLAGLVTVLTLVLIPLTIIGAFGVAGLMGVGVLATMMASLFIVVGVLASMQGIENAQANADILILLLNAMTSALVQISLLAPLAVIGVAAISVLITLVAKLGLFVVAIGWLLDKVPEIESFINTGLEIFKKLAGGIGEVISAFGVGLSSGLPEIGDNLSKFTTALGPFVDNVKGIGDDVATGAGNLTKAILCLLAADFLAGIANACGISFTDLAVELNGFAAGVAPFIALMSEVKPETLTGIKNLCDALNALTGATFWNGLNDLIFGDSSLSTFGTSISKFATCIKDSAEALKGITDEDVENIERSATAGTALAELNAAIPGQDGWAQKIMGSKDLSDFGESIVAFAGCLVEYSKAVSGKSIDTEAIKNSVTAGTSLSDLNNAIPKQGGWAQAILGEQDLATFGASIVKFAECLVDYSTKVSGKNIDAEAIKNSAVAGTVLSDLANAIPKQGGWAQAILGEQDMATFGNSLKAFGKGLADYADSASTIDQDKVDKITFSGKAIDAVKEVVDKIPESGGWGEKIFGSADGESFGNALSSLAKGIKSYCSVAEGIGQDQLDDIAYSGKAIEALKTVINALPDAAQTEKAADVRVAIDHLMCVVDEITQLNGDGYSSVGFDALLNSIKNLSTTLTDLNAVEMASDAYNVYKAASNFETCGKELSKLNKYTYEGIDDLKAALKSVSEFDFNFGGLSDKAGDAVAAVKNFISSMAKGLSGGTSTLETTAAELGAAIYRGLTSKAKDIKSAGGSLVQCLATGLSEAEGTVKKAGISLAAQVASGVSSNYLAMWNAGGYLGSGLVSGIQSKYQTVYWAAYTLGQMAVLGEKAGQASNSPSKATIKAGKWLGEGLVIGISRMGKSVYEAGKSMGQSAIGSISNSISKISELVESDMDAQPTIRPVLDLSDVRSGVGAIGGMFGGTSLGVSANLGAISTMMNARGQNGGTSDVVSAIDKLRKDLSNISGDTYQINGVTYDDGSNVHDAISSIVRYAKIERRV